MRETGVSSVVADRKKDARLGASFLYPKTGFVYTGFVYKTVFLGFAKAKARTGMVQTMGMR